MNKPDYKTFIKSQLNNSYIIKCPETGFAFREIKGRLHRFILLLILLSLQALVPLSAHLVIDILLNAGLAPFLYLIFAFVLLLVIGIFGFIIGLKIIYNISKFEVINTDELSK